MRISDDGCGMLREELPLALERHATSKLQDDDLLHIKTLGFRGEALPSIAAVSRLAITSRRLGTALAHAITVEAGTPSAVRPAALTPGTVVEVRDLFFSVPARLRFLRSERSETAEALDVLRRLAIANSGVAFTFTTGERQLLDLHVAGSEGMQLRQRIADLLGRNFLSSSIPFDVSRGPLHVSGFAGLPTHHRAQSNMQIVIVNGRPVRDRLIMGAIRAAYTDVLPRGRFPMIVMSVACPPPEIDVNVHPAKLEVRFRDPALFVQRSSERSARRWEQGAAPGRSTPRRGWITFSLLRKRRRQWRSKFPAQLRCTVSPRILLPHLHPPRRRTLPWVTPAARSTKLILSLRRRMDSSLSTSMLLMSASFTRI